MLLLPTCLSFCLPVSPVCLPVSQALMNDSGRKEKTGQLLNSRVLGVLEVITLTMTSQICQSQSKLSQTHLTHVLIQPSVIASNRCVRG